MGKPFFVLYGNTDVGSAVEDIEKAVKEGRGIFNNIKKNGAPKHASRIPTGSSIGSNHDLATVSAKTTNMAPPTAEKGSK